MLSKTPRERLMDEVFSLNTIPNLGREQWDALEVLQGGLTPEQAGNRVTLEFIAELIEELGVHVMAVEDESQLTRDSLLSWLRDRQLACEPNTPADLACTMLQVYLKLWVSYA